MTMRLRCKRKTFTM